MPEAPDPSEERRRELEAQLAHIRTRLSTLVGLADWGPKTPPPPSTLAAAPPIAPELRAAEELVVAIDEEVRRVDVLLARVAERERGFRTQGFPSVGPPHRVDEFTLYARPLPGTSRVEYVFSADLIPNAVPVPLPEGFRVVRDQKTGFPSLEKKS